MNINSKKMKFRIYMFSVIILIFAAFNTYFTFLIHKELKSVVSNPGRWPAGSYVYDPEIGFDFATNVSAPIKDNSFYVKSHRLGYRISKRRNSCRYSTGGVMSLGCSFTYGDEVESNETFTQVIADNLRIHAYNYGVCSFSYIHALLKAKKLKDLGILDNLQPKYLVLGCWEGLVDRSKTPFPPLSTKSLPIASAYIIKDGEDLRINSPLNTKHTFDMVNLYRNEGVEMSFNKFVKIFFTAPRYIYLYLHNKLLFQRQQKRDFNNNISEYDVYSFYFTEIEKLFSKYKTKIIVLYMPTSPKNHAGEGLKKALADHSNIMFVDGLKAIEKYDVSTKDYQGKHPQANAHKAYGLETASMIRLSMRNRIKH